MRVTSVRPIGERPAEPRGLRPGRPCPDARQGILGGPRSAWDTRRPLIRKHLEHRPAVDFGMRWQCSCGHNAACGLAARPGTAGAAARWLHDDTVSQARRGDRCRSAAQSPAPLKLSYEKLGSGNYFVLERARPRAVQRVGAPVTTLRAGSSTWATRRSRTARGARSGEAGSPDHQPARSAAPCLGRPTTPQ